MRAERIRLVRRREIDACPETVLVQSLVSGWVTSTGLGPPTLKCVLDECRPDRGLVDHILPTIFSIAFTNALKSYKTSLRRLWCNRTILDISRNAHDYPFDG